MAKSRTVSLKGPAAAALVGSLAGKLAKTEDEVLTRAATLVYIYVKTSQMPKAVAILKDLQATGKVPENA